MCLVAKRAGAGRRHAADRFEQIAHRPLAPALRERPAGQWRRRRPAGQIRTVTDRAVRLKRAETRGGLFCREWSGRGWSLAGR